VAGRVGVRPAHIGMELGVRGLGNAHKASGLMSESNRYTTILLFPEEIFIVLRLENFAKRIKTEPAR